ncbi:MAG: hypothetical protein ACR2OX_02090 [Methyloligellaceae bacterium]
MIGGPIGLGLGVPLVTTTAAIQSGAFASTGATAVAAVGRSTAATAYALASSTVVDIRGQARAETSFLLESYTTVAGIGRSTSEAATTINGTATPDFVGAFSVPPTRDAVPFINAGAGCLSVAAGHAEASANGGTGCNGIKAGEAKRSVSGGSAGTNIGP